MPWHALPSWEEMYSFWRVKFSAEPFHTSESEAVKNTRPQFEKSWIRHSIRTQRVATWETESVQCFAEKAHAAVCKDFTTS